MRNSRKHSSLDSPKDQTASTKVKHQTSTVLCTLLKAYKSTQQLLFYRKRSNCTRVYNSTPVGYSMEDRSKGHELSRLFLLLLLLFFIFFFFFFFFGLDTLSLSLPRKRALPGERILPSPRRVSL